MYGCSNPSSGPNGSPSQHPSISSHANENALNKAIEAQNKHTKDLMQISGVIGTGVGLNEEDEATPEIIVFTEKDVKDVKKELDGFKTRVVNVGKVEGFGGKPGGTSTGFTGTYSPVPCGVSVGNDLECASGTLGCVVQSRTDPGKRYALSNNHVFARENAGSLGERLDQPGRYDNSCNQTGQFATLAGFNTISATTSNAFDAAIAEYTTNNYTLSMVNNLYTPSNTVVQPAVGLAVKKVGRTTGLTTGKIGAINVTIKVSYVFGTATFTNQIYVKGQFIKAGDSGSLMVTSTGNNPVGLDFAGSGNSSFASPIQPVLDYFNVDVASN